MRLPLSIDWEDWFQLCCPPYDAPGALDRFACRLPQATEATLALCADLGATATWFCLADQAQRHPSLLRRVQRAGHRVGLHGATHRRAFEQERAAWRADLKDAKARLEDLCGAAVTAYRAPEWSLRGVATDWWRDLPELGFGLDASRAPLAVVGDLRWPRRPHRLAEDLWELPSPTLGVGRLRAPLWGWGLRVLPFSLTRRALEDLAREDAGTPLVLHPWELDEGQPALPRASWGHRFAHGAGLRGYATRLRDLLAGIRLVSLEAWVEGR